jgi:hypothetical protein
MGAPLGVLPPSRNQFEMGLGLPGVPDVDFVPYAAGTNRFGGKGPALLGHPISWEVVGTTLKSPFCDWQWNVNLAGNTLTMEAGPYPMPGTALPATATDGYNFASIVSYDAAGGLYVMFTFTGEGFSGSLTGGRTAIAPVVGSEGRAPFELFRVLSIVGYTITLRSEKQLINYYTAGNGCRAVTFLRPKVTRLAALPVPGVAKTQPNRTFVFMPPETSANSEYMPPYTSPAGTGTWTAGGFDVSGTISPGINYGNSVNVPIPRPIARVDANILVGGPYPADLWHISLPVSSSAVVPGRIVRITNLVDGAATGLTSGGPANVYGYFQVQNVVVGPPDDVTLLRVTEINPDSGAVFYGAGPTASGAPVPITIEVFDNVSSFFLDASFRMDRLAAMRLTGLIDPRSVGPSITTRDATDFKAVPPSRPDRAIFNTKSGEDPGNMLDLGFRAVFFPAKTNFPGGPAVPDFNRPIDGNDLTINPTLSERQFIEVDYSAGVAYLSTTPLVGDPRCDVAPTIDPLSSPNNPRGEVVLFAACVPYSMEEGQTGSGVRVTGSSLDSLLGGFGPNDFADVYGRRVITFPNAVQTLDPGATPQVVTTLTDLKAVPPAGFFFVARNVGGDLVSRDGPYYYQYTTLVGPNVQLSGVTGPVGAVALDPALGWEVVLQRSLRSHAPTLSSSDTVRGASKRATTLSFANTNVRFAADGSIIIDPEGHESLDDAYHFGRVIRSTSGPVEARTSDQTVNPAIPYGLPSHFLSRYELGSLLTSSTVGYDFIGRRDVLPYTGGDNLAGYMDRRVFAPASGNTILGTISSPSFNVNTLGTDQISITTAANQFHDGTGKTTLFNDVDLVEIPGFGVYVLHSSVLGTPTDYHVRNLDGSTPVLAAGAVIGCTVYRPRFHTGRGFDTGALLGTQGATWIAGQGPKPALRLWAGSAYVQNGPDNGGATNALEFWYRVGESTPTTHIGVDTFGRVLSSLKVEDLTTHDNHYRGNYITRQLVNNPFLLGSSFSAGHFTEEWTGGYRYGYDFASLRAFDGVVYSFSVTANNEITINGLAPDSMNMLVGAGLFISIENLTLPSPSTAPNGMYVSTSSVRHVVGPTVSFLLKSLSGSTPLTIGDTGLARFFLGSFLGKFYQAPYKTTVSPAGPVLLTHSPSMTVVLSKEPDAVGVHIAGPNQATRGPDARALRVTATDEFVAGDGFRDQATMVEISFVGVVSARKSFDYLPARTTSKKVSAHAFQAEKISSNAADAGTNWYYPGIGSGILSNGSGILSNGSTSGNYNVIAKLDLADVLPGGCVVDNIVVRVLPGADRHLSAPGNRMLFSLLKGDGTSVIPTTLASANDTGFASEQDVTLTPGAPETLDFTAHTYWLLVASANNTIPGNDFLFSATLNYVDPGPRN